MLFFAPPRPLARAAVFALALPAACEASEVPNDEIEGLQPFVVGECGSWNPPQATPPGAPIAERSCAQGVCFTEQAEAAGLGTTHFVPTHPTQLDCIFPRTTLSGASVPREDCAHQWGTGGASVGDVDGDGWPDVFMTRLAAPDHLFLNQGDGTFVDVAAQVGLEGCSWTNGSVFGDIDNDGDLDLLVTSLGAHAHQLWINQRSETGELRFIDEAEARGFALTSAQLHAGQSVTLGDVNRDGWLDVHVNEWITTGQLPAPTDPDFARHGGRLLINLGEGVFEDRSQAYGVTLEGADELGIFAFASTFVDLDEDGWQELVITVDSGSSRLFWNQAGASYLDGTQAAGVNLERSAMGSSFGDLDGDGRLDWFVSAIAEEGVCAWDETPPCYDDDHSGNRMYLAQGARSFAEASLELGLRDGDWAWGVEMFDFDNDADLDLALANGWYGRDNFGQLSHLDTPARLWLNPGAAAVQAAVQGGGEPFEELAAARGLLDTEQGRTLLSFDYDRDGDLDLLITTHAGAPRLFRNEGGDELAWLRVELEGRSSNRDGRGAKLRVQVEPEGPWQVREVGAASHFLGEGELIQHFGLGPDFEFGVDRVHRVEVEWPASGTLDVFESVGGGETLRVIEGES